MLIWLYIALNRTPSIDCYWGGSSTQTIPHLSLPKKRQGSSPNNPKMATVKKKDYGIDEDYNDDDL